MRTDEKNVMNSTDGGNKRAIFQQEESVLKNKDIVSSELPLSSQIQNVGSMEEAKEGERHSNSRKVKRLRKYNESNPKCLCQRSRH